MSCSRLIAAKSRSTAQKPTTATQRYGCPISSQSLQDCERASIRQCTMERLHSLLLFPAHPQKMRRKGPNPPSSRGRGRCVEIGHAPTVDAVQRALASLKLLKTRCQFSGKRPAFFDQSKPPRFFPTPDIPVWPI